MEQPSGNLNISQILFKEDSNKAKDDGITAAYLNQARLSTYYQDNPWKNLTFVNQFGLNTMGGKLNTSQPSGAKVGNQYVLKPVVQNVIPAENYSMVDFYSFLKQ